MQEFIDAGVKDQSEDLSERVLGLYKKNINKVEAAVKAAFEDSGFYTDDVDGDVNGVKIIRPELDDPLVLERASGADFVRDRRLSIRNTAKGRSISARGMGKTRRLRYNSLASV